jgi:dynein heavy chain, axonemal
MYTDYDAQSTAQAIAVRLAESEKAECVMQTAREQYRPLAARASLLYHVCADLSRVSVMYQYSLNFFTRLFRR